MNDPKISYCISALPQPKRRWKHSSPQSTRMYEFMRMISSKYRVDLPEYRDLHRWSIDNVASFWEEVWGFTGVVAGTISKDVVETLSWRSCMGRRGADISRSSAKMLQCSLAPSSSLMPDSTSLRIYCSHDVSTRPSTIPSPSSVTRRARCRV